MEYLELNLVFEGEFFFSRAMMRAKEAFAGNVMQSPWQQLISILVEVRNGVFSSL